LRGQRQMQAAVSEGRGKGKVSFGKLVGTLLSNLGPPPLGAVPLGPFGSGRRLVRVRVWV